MKKLWIPIITALVGLGLGGALLSPEPLGAHAGGTGMMGPGMTGSRMMGQGQRSPGYGGYSNWQTLHEECEEMMERMMGQWQQTTKALTSEDAVSIAQNYLSQTKNPNLTVGKVETKEDGDYLVEILTKDGSLVDKLEINHFTGWFHSIYAEE